MEESHRAHRGRSAGPKAERKKERSRAKAGLSKNVNKNNIKAFTVSSRVKARKAVQRNLDREHKKEHVPLVDRQVKDPLAAPPIVVVVAGPPGVGKSTLIKSLVKRYTKRSLKGDPKGPITVVSGKKRRLTFFECELL